MIVVEMRCGSVVFASVRLVTVPCSSQRASLRAARALCPVRRVRRVGVQRVRLRPSALSLGNTMQWGSRYTLVHILVALFLPSFPG